jgi:hypothetical protein
MTVLKNNKNNDDSYYSKSDDFENLDSEELENVAGGTVIATGLNVNDEEESEIARFLNQEDNEFQKDPITDNYKIIIL